MEIQQSKLNRIDSVHIEDYYRGIEIVDSEVGIISNSSFTTSGSSQLLYAGAVLVQNSNVSFFNTSFIQNQAISGAAVASL